MVRFKDSDTLDFLAWLKFKGESFGFIADIAYYLGKKDYFVDVVWKFGEDQSSFVTFDVETRNCGKIFSNTSRIYETTPVVISKPRSHFMIMFKDKLSEIQRGLIEIFS